MIADQYMKKPQAVCAFQMTESRMQLPLTHAKESLQHLWPDWLIAAWEKPRGEQGALSPVLDDGEEDHIDQLQIFTLEGPHIVNKNAWIIQGVEGEIWAVQDSIFRKTYQRIENMK